MADFTAACEFAGSDVEDMEDDHGGRASPLSRPTTARQQLDFEISTEDAGADTGADIVSRKRRVSTCRSHVCSIHPHRIFLIGLWKGLFGKVLVSGTPPPCDALNLYICRVWPDAIRQAEGTGVCKGNQREASNLDPNHSGERR